VAIPTPCSRAAAAARLDEYERGLRPGSGLGPAPIVADAETDEMIGIVSLRLREHDSAELGYGVAAGRRNRGLASAAVRLVARWCLDERAAARVELRIARPDLASRRVGAKAGFSREGLVCTHVAATGRDYDDLLFTLR
jgi:RimJ/RimL family protein N-acetyltransferase